MHATSCEQSVAGGAIQNRHFWQHIAEELFRFIAMEPRNKCAEGLRALGFLSAEFLDERAKEWNVGQCGKACAGTLEKMANKVVAGAAEAAFGGLKLCEGELLIQDHGGDPVAQNSEGFDAGSHHSTLPSGELGGQCGICGFGSWSNFETSGVNRMKQCMEFCRHRVHIHLIHATKGS